MTPAIAHRLAHTFPAASQVPRTRHHCFMRFVIFVALGAAAMPNAQAGDKLVLVSAVNSPMRALPLSEVRRSFLGAVHSGSANQVVPIRNLANPEAHQMFVDQVLTISAPEYDRRLAMRSMQSGLGQLNAIRDAREIERVLLEFPNGATYMFASDAAKLKSLQVVQELGPGKL